MKEKLIALYILLVVAFSECANAEHQTPIKYRYVDKTDTETYLKTKLVFIDSITNIISRNGDRFYNNAIYNINTKVEIDTLLLNADKTKSVFFVITDNSKNEPDSKNFYDGFCFIAEVVDGKWKFSSMGPFFYENYYDRKKISKVIRKAYFLEYYEKGNPYRKYNMDDIRFWNGIEWTTFK